jgi:hypothetical protein
MKARMDVFKEKLEKIDAAGKSCLGKMEVNIGTSQKPRQAESKSSLEEIDTTVLGANRENSEAAAVHQEVSKKEVAMEIIGAPEDRSMIQEPAV